MLGEMSQACVGMALQTPLKSGLKENTRGRQAWTLTHPSMKFPISFYYVKKPLGLFVRAAGNVLRAGMKAGSWICQGQRDREQGRSCAPRTATVTSSRDDQRPSAHPWHFGDINAFSKYPLLPSKSNTCLRMLLSLCQPLEKLLTAAKMLLKLWKTIPLCHFGLSQGIPQTTCSIGIFMGILLFSHLNMCHVYIPFDYFPPENPELGSISQ